MILSVIQRKWNGFRQNIRNGWDRQRSDQRTTLDDVRERSISILQKRYGYTREQAASELDKHYSNAWLG